MLTFAFVLLLLVATFAAYVSSEMDRPGPLAQPAAFVVPRGEGSIEVVNRLERQGVIANAMAMKLHAAMLRLAGSLGLTTKSVDIKAGEYEIERGASMRKVLAALTDGRAVQHKITLPEGLTSQQIVSRFEADQGLTGAIERMPAEGSLIPDTYRYVKGAARQDIVDRMQAEHKRFVAAAWAERQAGLPFATPEEALVLASIVEKETGRTDERDRVAAVFINRLRKRMRLQSDPTIIYGVVGGAGSLGRPIHRSDIDQRTPYNTYQIDGLPPTPICNPGRASIRAVLNPAKSDDLYFVADGSGGHAFAASLKDHNANVANWRRIDKEQRGRRALAESQRAAVARAGVRVRPEPAANALPLTAGGTGVAETLVDEGVPSDTAEASGASPTLRRVGAAANASTIPLPIRKPAR